MERYGDGTLPLLLWPRRTWGERPYRVPVLHPSSSVRERTLAPLGAMVIFLTPYPLGSLRPDCLFRAVYGAPLCCISRRLWEELLRLVRHLDALLPEQFCCFRSRLSRLLGMVTFYWPLARCGVGNSHRCTCWPDGRSGRRGPRTGDIARDHERGCPVASR
jgi:hypothetical protein